MPTLNACDVSYFQPVVDDSYPFRWLIFRCCDGDFIDPNMLANAAWAKAAVTRGRMDGWTVYAVWRPGMNAHVLANLALVMTTDSFVMVDVESWGGQISGDHSAEITQLVNALAAKYGQSHVWVYGNAGDLASLYPNRPAWVRLVVASYGTLQPSLPNMVGWQYTDGQHITAGRPHSTAPFGACDHNVLYLTDADVGTDTTSGGGTLLEDFLMALSDGEQQEILAAARQWNKRFGKFDRTAYAVLGDSKGQPGIRTVLQAIRIKLGV